MMSHLPAKSFRRVATMVAIAFLCALPTVAQRQERVVDSWRPLHYDINLQFNDQLTEIANAKVSVSVEVLSDHLNQIDFDFGELPIDSILVNGTSARFQRTSETLDVMLSKPANSHDRLTVTITYHGRPKDGLVFAADKDNHPSATGDNWPNRVHYWIPSLDHPSAKATVSFTIWASPRNVVVANGRWLSTTKNGGAVNIWRFDEQKPIPAYCMVVAVNQGVLISPPDQTATTLSYNVPQRDRDFAPKGFSSASSSVVFFNQTVAPYPYEKLALIVGATRFGGMENSSAIVFPSTLFDARQTDRVSARFGIPMRLEEVVAHEIAHQWFGDSVTEATWADLWLSEGFATYFAGLFVESQDGEAAFRQYMRDAAERYFRYEQQTNLPIHDTVTTDLMRLLNPNNYEKGAWVLHMLRKQLGDEAFFKGIRSYYLAHRESNATTEDLRTALEKASGKNLKQFFARWIYGSGHPVYQISFGSAEFAGAGGSAVITLKQLQNNDAFLDPVPVEIVSSGEEIRRVIVPQSKTTTVSFPVKGSVTLVTVDPDETLLREVKR